jgi:hypothetical protein
MADGASQKGRRLDSRFIEANGIVITFTRRQHTRPLMAVQPVANDLGLTADTSCTRDDADCWATFVENYVSEGAGKNILICWEHDDLTGIVQVLGDSDAPGYPDDS